MIKRIAPLLITIILLSLSAPALAAEPGKGIIEGRVVNGTAGGSSVAGQMVTLTTYLNDAESGTSTSQTNAEGQFAFSGLSTGTGYSYEIKLAYQGAGYTGELLNFTANETTKYTTLTVYDSTNSDKAVNITAAHTIIYLGDGNLEVVEYLVFNNASDRSYIGSGEITTTGSRRTLKLPLPIKVAELKYGGDLVSRYVLQDANGLFDTMVVLPGEKLIAYSYKVDYSSGAYKFSRKIDYPVTVYSFLVEGESTRVTSERLAAGTPMTLEGVKFNTLSGNNLAAGDTVDVRLSGLPQTSNQLAIIWVVLVLIVLVVGGSFIYLKKKKSLQAVSIDGRPDQLKQRLLLELADLDDDFEDGRIEKDTYAKLRAEKKAQLVGLMQNSKEESDRG